MEYLLGVVFCGQVKERLRLRRYYPSRFNVMVLIMITNRDM